MVIHDKQDIAGSISWTDDAGVKLLSCLKVTVLNISHIPVYQSRYRYFIQNNTISVKFYRISFWTDMSRYITMWPIYRPIFEMKIS